MNRRELVKLACLSPLAVFLPKIKAKPELSPDPNQKTTWDMPDVKAKKFVWVASTGTAEGVTAWVEDENGNKISDLPWTVAEDGVVVLGQFA